MKACYCLYVVPAYNKYLVCIAISTFVQKAATPPSCSHTYTVSNNEHVAQIVSCMSVVQQPTFTLAPEGFFRIISYIYLL